MSLFSESFTKRERALIEKPGGRKFINMIHKFTWVIFKQRTFMFWIVVTIDSRKD